MHRRCCTWRRPSGAVEIDHLQVGIVPVEIRRLLAMAAGSLGNHFDFGGIEAEQLGIFDQVVRMAVVAIVIDGVADIVEQRAIFKQFARARRQ